ncbi:MAG: prepilin-type N-terminal cleavage/methylation domain-containing protein [Planctomycetaceae bacterium]|nr:prepilin-type N-terminal cleavage/methylation domain-containing protein [Planctomycetaceae bacterium]
MKKNGFTLIELLVVVAIIALLLSILLPGLRAAKLQAQLTIDLTNLGGLSKAWMIYTQDNDDEIVGGNAPGNASGTPGTWTREPYFCWVDYPISKANPAQYAGSNFDTAEEILGIQNGLLFPYVSNPDTFHCPADKRFLKPPTRSGATALNGGYRSYSIPGGLRAGSWDAAKKRYAATGSNWQYIAYTQYSQIKSPGNKFLFVEENDGRGLNAGAWEQDMRLTRQPSSAWRWVDAPAVWHFDRSSFGFADGHAEKHKWADPTLIPAADQGQQYIPVDLRGVDDFAFVLRSFPYQGLP